MAWDQRLNCTKCGRFTQYEVEQETADGGYIVRCESCGKRHGDTNIHTVDLSRRYKRDEAGNLLEDLP
jgi:uncharacterized Zn finger protein